MGKTEVAEEFFVRGEELLVRADRKSALECFRQAYKIDPSLARYSSAYGFTIALVERRLDLQRDGHRRRLANLHAALSLDPGDDGGGPVPLGSHDLDRADYRSLR